MCHHLLPSQQSCEIATSLTGKVTNLRETNVSLVTQPELASELWAFALFSELIIFTPWGTICLILFGL